MLRRRPRVSPLRAAAVSIVLHCNRHPDEDYLPLHDRSAGPTSAAWTAAHRENRSRQLVVVQELRNDRLAELRSLAAISSPHVARLLALYHVDKTTFSVQEHVDLDVLELCPLCEREIAAIFSQVLRGLLSLLVLGIGFRVACVRTTVSGAVKIVLDWSYEPTVDPRIRLAGTAYLAGFLEQVMHGLGGARRDWSPEARDFLRILAAGCLPAEWHAFLSRPKSISSAAWFALRRKLAACPGPHPSHPCSVSAIS